MGKFLVMKKVIDCISKIYFDYRISSIDIKEDIIRVIFDKTNLKNGYDIVFDILEEYGHNVTKRNGDLYINIL